MNIDFTDKVALVTGATRGIGQKIASDLEAANIHLLILTGTDPNEVNRLNQESRIDTCERHYLAVDLSDTASFENFKKELRKFPRIDVCINNAAVNNPKPLLDTDERDWDQTISVNLQSAFFITKLVAEKMTLHNYGRIVNISSIYSKISKARRSLYTITKTGLNGLTVSSAIELAQSNVLVNSVSPGFVLTDLTKKNLTNKERERLVDEIPIGRLAEPKDISSAVLFLASDLNSYISGHNLVVDGGYTNV
jgi:NAD(P)-dependent dehydrogenase (short-subunit alcohol dehydrogenase family)